MLVSHRHRFICLKTRKTAGTSVEIFLEPHCHGPEPYPGPAHSRAALVTRDGIIAARGGKGLRERERWYNHMSAEAVRDGLGAAIWDSYWKFCVVRNPYDRAVSAFWFNAPPEVAALPPDAPFAAIRAHFAAWPGQHPGLLDNAHFYMVDGRYALDGVLRYESLQADLDALATRLALPPTPWPLGRYKGGNRRRAEPWQEYYTPALARRVEEAAAVDFTLFGYPRLSG